jgi:hypothetical protein
MKLRDLIDESVLADARKVDNFVRKHDPSQPSIENTLRLVRDVDTDVLRRIGKDIWGVGESGDLVRTSFDNCTGELDRASNQASAWTGDANNAYKVRIDKIKKAIVDMRSPSQDVGEALVALGDTFDSIFGGTLVDILTILGLIISIIGVIVAIVFFETGIGAIIGLVVAVIGLLIAAAGFYFSMQAVEENKIKALDAASAAAQQTLGSAGKATP